MDQEKLHIMRHSMAHIMAAAILRLWPEAKFGVGPVIENGFYYDIDLGDIKISESNFAKIEKSMRELIEFGDKFEKVEMPIDEAIKWAKDNKQPYKEELLNDLKRSGTTVAKEIDADELGVSSDGKSAVDVVTFYKNGKFTDLCRGPHLASAKEAGVFKLMRIAGAYWRGKETNPQMQRLYGVAFATQKELDDYLEMLEQAKLRDHRKLGQDMDLFHIDQKVGLGLPLWHPKGALLWRMVEDFWYSEHLKNGYELVRSPHIGNRELWETSGHWGFYNGSMYPPMEIGQSLEERQNNIQAKESEEFLLKPMNCPFHVQIYKNSQRSYRDFPFRWAECGTVYRFEKKGELSGLTRVRGFTQDDAHIFCRIDQVEDELKRVVDFILFMFESFGFDVSLINVYLSLRDPKNTDKYAGSDEGWEFTESVLRKVATEKGLNFREEEGEAAFYGPKLDFKLKDALGREWQCSTLQFDFNLPERFEMEYANNKGENERPYVLHRALFGSFERFLALLIEHYAGKFPVWLCPEQVRIVSVNQNEKTIQLVEKVEKFAKDSGIRVNIDNNNESVGKKIRNSESMKVPFTVIIGDKEVESGRIGVRIRKDLLKDETANQETICEIEKFIEFVSEDIKTQSMKTSLL